TSEDRLDLKAARDILDRDHYDLKPVKERILEYLAVRTLNPTARGSIMCFVGPPGVGKTSLGQSIAEALGRRFTRVSLGGVRDEGASRRDGGRDRSRGEYPRADGAHQRRGKKKRAPRSADLQEPEGGTPHNKTPTNRPSKPPRPPKIPGRKRHPQLHPRA